MPAPERLLFKQWLLHKLCSLIDHRGPAYVYAIDDTGNFMIFNCGRCHTLIVEALNQDLTKDDYLDVLDKWF